MAQATKVLIADGDVLSSTPNNEVIYFASNASGIPVVPGSHHILPTNPYTLVFDDAGKPSGYDRKNNRHTVAMDVKFVEDFLEIESCHTGIIDRKSTRLNSSHLVISYAVFCLKKKKYSRAMLSLYNFRRR